MVDILDFRERYEDPVEHTRAAMDGHQTTIWTALPGIISKFDAEKLTVEVQPSINVLRTGANKEQRWERLPVLPDVPVVFPRGGKYALTFPITQGDECLVVFSSRCIDNWWNDGDVQNQRELRMHDLSDGFCIPGPWSQKTKIDKVSTTTTQLRTSDGMIYVEIDNDNEKIRLIDNDITIEIDHKNSVINMNGANTINISAKNDININAQNTINLRANQINEN